MYIDFKGFFSAHFKFMVHFWFKSDFWAVCVRIDFSKRKRYISLDFENLHRCGSTTLRNVFWKKQWLQKISILLHMTWPWVVLYLNKAHSRNWKVENNLIFFIDRAKSIRTEDRKCHKNISFFKLASRL